VGDVQTETDAEIERLRAEVKHWKDHAQEAGEGFSQACRDYARVNARRSELIRKLEAWIRHGEAVPADVTTYDRAIVNAELRALIEEARHG